MKKIIVYISAIFLFIQLTAFCNAADRFALVIGNSSYEESPLNNPVNDADGMELSLKSIGFSVIKRVNLTQQDLKTPQNSFEFNSCYESKHLFK
jgi:hypothetical protein